MDSEITTYRELFKDKGLFSIIKNNNSFYENMFGVIDPLALDAVYMQSHSLDRLLHVENLESWISARILWDGNRIDAMLKTMKLPYQVGQATNTIKETGTDKINKESNRNNTDSEKAFDSKEFEDRDKFTESNSSTDTHTIDNTKTNIQQSKNMSALIRKEYELREKFNIAEMVANAILKDIRVYIY